MTHYSTVFSRFVEISFLHLVIYSYKMIFLFRKLVIVTIIIGSLDGYPTLLLLRCNRLRISCPLFRTRHKEKHLNLNCGENVLWIRLHRSRAFNQNGVVDFYFGYELEIHFSGRKYEIKSFTD